MAIPAVRSWLLALLASAAVLGPAANTVSGNSPAPIDETQSCASQEYKELKGRSDPNSGPVNSPMAASVANRSTLLVVPGNKTLRLNTTTYVGMGKQITVCIMGLHDWIYVQNQHPNDLRLSIGGHLLRNVPPSGIGPSEQEYLNFVLHLDATDSEDWKAWAAIVDASRHEEAGGKALITVATAADNQFYESTAYSRVVTGSDSWYWILVLFVVMIAILLYLAATSDLLRYTLAASPTRPQRSPFSLGLVQMAFWFCLSLAAYVYICLMTRQAHVPMGSVLGLLGISSTTGLAAVFVDKQKSAATDALAAERAALTARIKDLSSAPVATGSSAETDLLQKKNRLAQVQALLAQSPSDNLPATSKGFLTDILSDGENVSFHRFQMVVWTIVLGVIFVWSVYRNMTMPEFDASLLTLMGISSGTYIGFKFPEKLKAGDPSANAAAPAAA
jgi:cell division protein FtsB